MSYRVYFNDDSEFLRHEGVAHDENPPGRGSGRYEYGSGQNPNQRPQEFTQYIDKLRSKGLSDKEIADQLYPYSGEKALGQMRERYRVSKEVGKYIPDDYVLNKTFKDQLKKAHDAGLSNYEIAIALGLQQVKELNARGSIADDNKILDIFNENQKLLNGTSDLCKKDENGNGIPVTNRSERARMIYNAGLSDSPNESTIRTLETGNAVENAMAARKLADAIKEEYDKYDFLDVSKGTAQAMGVTSNRLDIALELLKLDGLTVQTYQFDQLGNSDRKNNRLLLCPEGTTYRSLKNDILYNGKTYGTVNQHSEDGGETFYKEEPPQSIDSSRVFVRYAEDGGKERDGTIDIRPGVPDLSLGKAGIAQVRIAVDDKYYMKGMAAYADDIPAGYDCVFNTNKKEGTELKDVLKPLKEIKNYEDSLNPFGATIKTEDELKFIQKHYTDPATGEKKLSAINVVHEAGDWGEYSLRVPSQFLAKQPALVEAQLNKTFDERMKEYKEISSLTNPVVKEKLLEEFADNLDSSANYLKAAPFKGQSTRVLMPIPTLKNNEVYAPGYPDGTVLALVRYPHGGTFEIPEVVVNNKVKEGIKRFSNMTDVIGINSTVATTLSGADFDGDFCSAIPIKSANGDTLLKVKTREDLPIEHKKIYDQMLEFEPKSYKFSDDYLAKYETPEKAPKHMSKKGYGKQMGIATNLIADMTLAGATPEDIVAATKYSMVVIDAYKHHLDWQKAKRDFEIDKLMKKYRGDSKGASSLITSAKSPVEITRRKLVAKSYMTPEEKERYLRGYNIYRDDPNMKNYVLKGPDGKELRDENGRKIWSKGDDKKEKKVEIYRMELEDDARNLISKTHPTMVEEHYAAYANKLKELARQSRSDARTMTIPQAIPEMKKKYKAEVDSLISKLNRVLANRLLSSKAQSIAGIIYRERKQSYEEQYGELDKDTRNKLMRQANTTARNRMRVKREDLQVEITPKEWEAIQNHAVSPSKLREIMKNTDMEKIKQYSMPRSYTVLSPADIARAETLLKTMPIDQVAQKFGVSPSTLQRNIANPTLTHSALFEQMLGL